MEKPSPYREYFNRGVTLLEEIVLVLDGTWGHKKVFINLKFNKPLRQQKKRKTIFHDRKKVNGRTGEQRESEGGCSIRRIYGMKKKSIRFKFENQRKIVSPRLVFTDEGTEPS